MQNLTLCVQATQPCQYHAITDNVRAIKTYTCPRVLKDNHLRRSTQSNTVEYLTWCIQPKLQTPSSSGQLRLPQTAKYSMKYLILCATPTPTPIPTPNMQDFRYRVCCKLLDSKRGDAYVYANSEFSNMINQKLVQVLQLTFHTH